MNLLDRIAYNAGSAFLRAAGVKRPDWPSWLIGMEQFMLGDENTGAMEAYATVPDVYFCVSLLQDFIASLPLDFYEGKGDTRVKLDPDEDGTPGFLWKAANKRQTGYDLTHDVVGHLLLGGNAYLMLEFDRPHTDPTIVSALWNLPSQNTTPVLAKGRGVKHYNFTQNGIVPQTIPTEQIVHACDFNPDDAGKGITRLEALELTWKRQRNMDRFEHEFYKRGGTAAGLYTSEQALMPPQQRQLKMDLNERVEGPKNFGRAILLPKGIKFERAGMTHAEMQFIETGNVTLATLLRAFKIPPILAGVKTGGLGGSDKGGANDMMLFLEHGVRPITRRLTAKFNEVLLRPALWKGRIISCEFDYSGVLAMQDVWLAQAQAYQVATGNAVMTVNEARERLGLEPSDDPKADELFAPDPPVFIKPGEQPFDGKPSEKKDEPAVAKESGPSPDLVRDLLRAGIAIKQEVYIERMRLCALRRFRNQQRRIADLLMDEGAMTFDLDAGAVFHDRAVNLDALLTQLDDEQDRESVRRLIEAITKAAGQATITQLGVEVAFDLLSNRAQQFIKEQTFSFVTNVDGTTRSALREALAGGIGNRETGLELVKRVNSVFKVRRANAQTIAVTESNTAFNAAQLEGARQASDESGMHITKQWITAHDEQVRGAPGGRKAVEESLFSHFTSDGQVAELTDLFYVGSRGKRPGVGGNHPGDEPCLMPGDPSLSAGNRINCRCAMIFAVVEPVEQQEDLSLDAILRR